MIKRLLRIGNKCLQVQAKPVEKFDTPELHQLIEDLFDTMKANAGVGIAAPQIGVSLQVVVFGFDHSKRYPHAKPIPETILINPSISIMNNEMVADWEGCLSVRGLRGLVHRYTQVRYSGYDALGNFFEREVDGFHAKLIQHELDHLTGTLFLERISNLKFFGFEDEIQELMQQTGR